MKRLARTLIGLYPAHWRKRYSDEFEALIEDSSPGIRGILDLMKGAIKMRMAIPSFPKLAMVLCAAGLLAGLAVSFLVTPQYVSTATLLFESAPGSPQAPLRAHMAQIGQQVFSRASLASIISDRRLNLYPEERAKRPLEDVIQQMRTRDIRTSTVSMGSIALTISFAYRDRHKAQDAVQALISKYVEAGFRLAVAAAGPADELARIEARLGAIERRIGMSSPEAERSGQATALADTTVEVLDPPSLPVKAMSPDRSRFMLYGFGAGLIAAMGIAVFRRRVPPPRPAPAATA